MEKNILLVIGLAILAAIVWYGGTSKPSTTKSTATTTATTSDQSTIKNMDEPTELKIEDLTVGTGAELTAGKTATVHYTGTLTDGTVFDSSVERGEPAQFAVGVGQLIEGFDKGLIGMKVGGKRKLTIPAALGYGDKQVSTIPANSTLIFEVELLGVE
ncbi:MAG: FKBP-type peptidyl-prolyl cis-trans isomerase [Patescibacteria group bacterium]